ncbi:DHS-like NAD/FAD-binding domain-containing protein [Zopfochytrium polystomum]|nr:DHS-like NAD/FAD-binding domain-containing protein [Zopfochytrium polystomum]
MPPQSPPAPSPSTASNTTSDSDARSLSPVAAPAAAATASSSVRSSSSSSSSSSLGRTRDHHHHPTDNTGRSKSESPPPPPPPRSKDPDEEPRPGRRLPPAKKRKRQDLPRSLKRDPLEAKKEEEEKGDAAAKAALPAPSLPVSAPAADFVDADLVARVAGLIRSAKRILVFTGAGISVSCGIPDFRSPGGIYSQLGGFGFSDPQEMFDLGYFKANPQPFYSFAKALIPPPNLQPSPTHRFIRALETSRRLLRNYTQNIDDLETAAGISPARFVRCHGSLLADPPYCVRCRRAFDQAAFRRALEAAVVARCDAVVANNVGGGGSDDDDDVDDPRRCRRRKRPPPMQQPPPRPAATPTRTSARLAAFSTSSLTTTVTPPSPGTCNGPIKPAITFFNEPLSARVERQFARDRESADLLLVLGTSLATDPVRAFVRQMPEGVARVYVNNEDVREARGLFDVFLRGRCEDVVRALCKALGWKPVG